MNANVLLSICQDETQCIFLLQGCVILGCSTLCCSCCYVLHVPRMIYTNASPIPGGTTTLVIYTRVNSDAYFVVSLFDYGMVYAALLFLLLRAPLTQDELQQCVTIPRINNNLVIYTRMNADVHFIITWLCNSRIVYATTVCSFPYRDRKITNALTKPRVIKAVEFYSEQDERGSYLLLTQDGRR